MQRISFSILIALFAASCTAVPVQFDHRVVFDAGEKLGGCAIGDLSPDSGLEIAVVASSGALRVVAEQDGSWKGTKVGDASGEMIQVAVGDVWPQIGADELVAVGMASGSEDSGGEGAVFVAGYDAQEKKYRMRPVFTDSALVHAVAVADLDPVHPGDEALVGGFSRNLTLLRFNAGAGATAEKIGTTPAPAKGMVPFKSGVAVACNDGSLVLVERGPSGWTTRVAFRAPAGLARLAVSGDRILAAGDDGGLWLIEGDRGQLLHDEELKLRGAVLSDLDPAVPGLEAATTGYGGDVTLLRDEGAIPWEGERLYHSRAGLHHLSLGELIDDAPGPELVTVGYAGEVVVIFRRR
ncbi:hypothetical protein [Engelhardtia mirabilis]|uniref:Uncharacterized protein n=1 Tax=Engelhardtia mirabilis TaxID=2528011 RepID=A0A518BRD6_9BACT|nr:hypothetical protein Pla133_46610 [Planctomycetes bacterium Pla133]QDV03867.1 hypothetical protein Pla86_46590 [Planctomycetes bacterium Pla86]